MQEEQRSLSSVETLSVWKLLRDDTVRWQVLSVVVINIGMQLSGIDAVRTPQELSNIFEEGGMAGCGACDNVYIDTITSINVEGASLNACIPETH